MKALQNRPVTVVLIALAIALGVLYGFLRIPSTEGFNPSDDGVILAQSYRILHGEVPHRDFIAIRPAGSGFLHLVHYFSPLPLELSARWFVLGEYFLTALLVSLVLMGSWFRGARKEWYLFLTGASVLVAFLLNQNHYNLFPWTTVDALFWFSVALYGWFRLKSVTGKCNRFFQALVLFATSCAALSRQTFLLPGLLLSLRMLLFEYNRQPGGIWPNLQRLMPALLAGLLPGWLYAGMLTATAAWPDFLAQIAGRTELWETGGAAFWKSFWTTPVLALFLAATGTGLIKIWRAEAGWDTRGIDGVLMGLKFISFVFKGFLAFAVFLKPEHLFTLSFAFFWMVLLDLFLIYLHELQLPRWVRPVFWILLAAWTSAVSLGDNSPVFALGWLAGAGFLLQLKDFRSRIYRKVKIWHLAVAGVLLPALLGLSVKTQREVNYRDLQASGLSVGGGSVFEGLRGIQLSPVMANYLAEIRKLYVEFGSPSGRFAVWPNNALIYPLLDSRNPFPLDWMQGAEYAGNESRVLESVARKLSGDSLVILVEKVNVKWIATQQVAVDWWSADYRYLPLLDSLARVVPGRSEIFDVYLTK